LTVDSFVRERAGQPQGASGPAFGLVAAKLRHPHTINSQMKSIYRKSTWTQTVTRARELSDR